MLEQRGEQSPNNTNNNRYIRVGSVTTKFERDIKLIGFTLGIEPLQKACLLGTARIIRKVLDTKE